MLPTEKTAPKLNLADLTILVYGPHKFGKSTLCSGADGALFLATEPGLNSLEVYQQPIHSWDELLVSAKAIAEGKHGFRTTVLDTVDNAYRMCAEYICRKYEVEHESDLEYGKGYAMINAEFHRVLNKLALLPYGLFLVSHSQEKEIETRTGKHTKIVPTLPDKARKIVLGLVDVILFCDLEPMTNAEGKPAYRRVLRTKPSLAYEAGDRTGRLPEVLPLDFAAFAAAFGQGRSVPGQGAVAGSASGDANAEAGPSTPRVTGAAAGENTGTIGVSESSTPAVTTAPPAAECVPAVTTASRPSPATRATPIGGTTAEAKQTRARSAVSATTTSSTAVRAGSTSPRSS